MPEERKSYVVTGEKTSAQSTGLAVPTTYDEAGYYITDNMRDSAMYGVTMMDNVQEGGKYRFGNGSVGQPAIAWVSDKDTGWYYIADANIGFAFAGAKVWDYGKTTTVYTPAAASSGNPTLFKIAGPAHTGQGSSETVDIDFALNRTITQTTVAATQRSFLLRAPTFTGAVGTAGVTATMAITAEPTVSGGVPSGHKKTALWIQQGGLIVGTDDAVPNQVPLLILQGTMSNNTWLELRGNASTMLNITEQGVTPPVIRWEHKTGATDRFDNVILFRIENNGDDPTLFVSNLASGSTARAALQVKTANQGITWQMWAQASDLRIGESPATTYWTIQKAGVEFTHAVVTSGVPKNFIWTAAAHTGLTASTEVPDVDWSLTRIVQWATGAITTQRAFVIRPPTYAFVAASTITTAATLAISGAPAAGTNATITNAYSLWIQAGQAQFDGAVGMSGNLTVSGWLRVGTTTDAVVAGDLAVGLVGGNRFQFDRTSGDINMYSAGVNATIMIRNIAATNGNCILRLDRKGTGRAYVAYDLGAVNQWIVGVNVGGTGANDYGIREETNGITIYRIVASATAPRSDIQGHMRLGTATDTATSGDFVAGLTGAARLFYDQSIPAAYLYDSAGAIAIQLSQVAATASVFNEQGADIDLRIEGDTAVNLVFVDASADSVGFGRAPTQFIDFARTYTDTAATMVNLAPTLTATIGGSYEWRFLNVATNALDVRTGITNSGSANLFYLDAQRNLSTDLGTLSNLVGVRVPIGHAAGVGAGTTTSSARGIWISCGKAVGTIDEWYGLRIDAGATGGTLTTFYGIYISPQTATNVVGIWIDSSTANNRFDSWIRIGTATDANAQGDIVAGLTGAARMWYDQSVPVLKFFDSLSAVADQISQVAATATVFNEQGADIDHRIEGDTQSNLFFLDASTDRIGIGTGSPAKTFHVLGQCLLDDAFRFYQGASDGSAAYSDFRTNPATGNAILSAKTAAVFINYDHGNNGIIICDGAANSVSGMNSLGDVGAKNGRQFVWSAFGGTATIASPDTGLKRQAAGIVGITNGSTGGGALNVGTATDSATAGDFVCGLTGAARFFYDQSVPIGYFYTSGGLISDQISQVAATPTVFNETGADIDHRIEGDTDANMLFVDASLDRIGFKTGAPATAIHLANSNVRMDLITALVGGGGGTASLGAVGNANTPTAAAQDSWATINLNGTTYFIPVWV